MFRHPAILMNTKKLFIFLVLISGLLFAGAVHAQNINQQNFSNIHVDDLSDDQIRQFMQKIQASGLSQDQLEQIATARGMSATEVQKLKSRVQKLQNQPGGNSNPRNTGSFGRNVDYGFGNDSLNTDSTLIKQQQVGNALESLKPQIFGQDLFKNAKTTFEPNLRLATPQNYVIGAGDQVLIDIYGYSEVNYQLKVSPEGSINVPYAGVIPVSGLTVEAATSRIKSKLSKIYSGLNSGNTKLSVAIGDIRSIKVILTGEVEKPGTYTLPSLASVFNALYSSGGPTDNGSFRNIGDY